ncbi:sensor histidine kinase [Agreia sp. PsM10]|uniref:sensor histidine kinase n=1 Tax=Agreia sp. PsM10 TaxID=3030533 RepID=UPI00345EB64A
MRAKLAMSYAGVVVLTGSLILVAVWVFLLRYVPESVYPYTDTGEFSPNRLDLIRVFQPVAAIVMIVLVTAGLLGGWVLAGRVLFPLDRIMDATRKASAGSLSHRIQLPGRNDEFHELADAFDTMLTRLEAQALEQQRFSANASHELRTPLTITKTLLDVARTDPDPDVTATIEQLAAINERAINLTEALLLLGRADQKSFVLEQVDLSLIAEQAAEILLPLAEKNGVVIDTSGEFCPSQGSPALLLQLTTNLIHNAIVHNLPNHGRIHVTSSNRADSVILTVENTGPVVNPEIVATLTEPFQRGVERVRSNHDGIGLGLAIVSSIVTAHNGLLSITAPPTGGLHVEVRLTPRMLPVPQHE